MDKIFKLKEYNTSVKTEIMAGVTTFLTMAYILSVNPAILSVTGMDTTAVLLATCIASFIGTLCMALMANLPFALSASMGLNAYLANTVVLKMGYTWQTALFAVFVEGIIFIVLSVTPVREMIFNSIPLELKKAVSAGIGFFICFIGLQNANLVVGGATLVEMINFRADFSTTGITAVLTLIGVLLIAVLYIKNVLGSILIGIFGVWFLGIICQLAGIYVPNPDEGFYSLLPTLQMTDFSKLGETFGQCFQVDFNNVGFINLIIVIFSFLFVDIFNTLGTLIGVASKTNMIDEDGRVHSLKPALLADAVATSAGAVFGTPTVTTYVESATGVGVGGRTGLTALTTAVLFLASTLLAPIFVAIPSFATAPALIMVGFLMFNEITQIKMDKENFTSAIPAYICIFSMPFFYSIAEGISLGIIFYVMINVCTGKYRNVNITMYILSVLFLLKYIFL